MTDRRAPTPAITLTRHFFAGLFDLGFLSEAAALSFGRMILGICAAFFSLGLLLVRIYVVKYVNLSSFDLAEPYRRAILADHAFAIAIPMWIVMFVTLMVSHALFPDETDFRVLMALPITRRLVFCAKLTAVGAFTGLFLVAGHVATAPLALVMALGRWVERPWPLEVIAFLAASILASAFAMLTIVALQGVMILWMPRARWLTWSATLRSVLVGGLIVLCPFLLRLPAESQAFRDGAAWIYFIPPAWFVGLERWFLGDPRVHIGTLATTAIGGIFGVAIMATATYTLLYRRFDRVALHPTGVGAAVRRGRQPRGRHAGPGRPVVAAVRSFTFLTLRRSVFHQGIVVALSAIGVGLACNSLLMAGLPSWFRHATPLTQALATSVIWSPLAMIFVACLATRVAIAVPIEQRANWIFRVAMRDDPREALSGAVSAMRRIGVASPVAIMMPLQWLTLGSHGFIASVVAFLWGLVFVEMLMQDWSKVPFTCSYVPGKRFVPQTILIGVLSFTAFTVVGEVLTGWTLSRSRSWWMVFPLLAVVLAVLGLRRASHSAIAPVAFEDDLPSEVHPLRLSID